jgi:putative ABC transport system permease protein
MPLLPRLSSLWRNLFYKAKREQQLTEEIDAYLEMLIEEKIEQGLSPEDARRAALIELGGREQVKERVREASMGHFLETLWQDLRYGLRMLQGNPGFAAVAVFSLALGIGANTAIFSLMDAVLLKMLPVKNPEQLFFLERAGVRREDNEDSGLSYAFFEQLRSHRDAITAVCATIGGSRVNVMVDGQAEVAQAQEVSGGFFATLGVNGLLGRTLTDDDDKIPGGHPVAVISYNYWQRRFARDPAIVGKSVSVNGHPFTIIGVTPSDFFGVTVGESPDLWAPAMMHAQLYPRDTIEWYLNNSSLDLLGRLKPEVTEQQARAVLTGILQQTLVARSGAQLSTERRQALLRQSVALKPASQGLSNLRKRFSKPLATLMAAVGLILLIACANVANLLLARAIARRKEIAVRLALGAGRLRLTRQLITESMLLALMGGALGLVFAWWGIGFLLALMGSGRNPVVFKLALDMRVLGFTAGASLLTGVLFGLAPAWSATRLDLTPALKDSARGTGGVRLWLGKSLVALQVALSLLLLIGAGLFARSLAKVKGLDAGFNREKVLLVSTDPQMIGYRGRQIVDLYQRILERIKAIPGVHNASLSRDGLLSGSGGMSSVFVQGRAPRREDNMLTPDQTGLQWLCSVGPEFFETAGMTILRGRGLTKEDDENAPRVAVINETFARYFFGNENPMGRRFGMGSESSEQMEIVGVVRDAKYNSLREPALRTYYIPYGQFPHSWRETTFQIRTEGDPTRIIAAVRQVAQEINANLPLYNIKTLAAQVDESLVQERAIGTVSSFFGLLALLLAAVGLYGIMAYSVSRRTQEIGIRMALGSQRGDVFRMVLSQGMKLVLIGMVLGLAASFAATRLVASYLFGITPTDPVTFVGVQILLLMVTLLACLVPAWRATRVDPLVALRAE